MATIGEIEKKLWNSVDTLRGNMSAEDYIHIILGILSLKYFSDKNDRNSFIVTEKASWDYIMNFASTSEIGQKLDEAFIELETRNKMLTGIFNKNYNKEGMDQKKLGNAIKILSNINFSQSEEDIIGRIYEYFLGHFFRDRGQKGGEFYTPNSIVQLIVNVLKPNQGTIYDPSCGTAGMLIQAKRYIKKHNGNVANITVYGQEYNNITWKLAKLNLVLNGFSLVDKIGNEVLGKTSADTLNNDLHKNQTFDFIMANPPFNFKKWCTGELLNDKRWQWGIPPINNANYAWISHIISKLNVNGKAVIILANGSLSSSQKSEYEIRKNLIENNKVDAIIELPDKLFYTTGIPASIWFFNNNKKTNKVLMISGSSIEGNMLSKKLRELKQDDIAKIVTLFDKHENAEEIAEIGFAKSVSKDELIENNFSFVPGRYVGSKEEIINKEQTKEEIKKISAEISYLFKEFNSLVPKVQEAINKALEFEDE